MSREMISKIDREYLEELRKEHPVRYWWGKGRNVRLFGVLLPSLVYCVLTASYRNTISFNESKEIHPSLIESQKRVDESSRERYLADRFEYYIKVVGDANRLIGQIEERNKLEEVVKK